MPTIVLIWDQYASLWLEFESIGPLLLLYFC